MRTKSSDKAELGRREQWIRSKKCLGETDPRRKPKVEKWSGLE